MAARDLDGDGADDLVTGAGDGGSRITGYLLRHLGGTGEEFGFDAFPGSVAGVFVG